jgi:hypothetical protein
MGVRNQQMITLARNHCTQMKFVQCSGQGMAEEATGLPINAREVRCPIVHSHMIGSNLEMTVPTFYREHCVGCEEQRPSGLLPTLAGYIAAVDDNAVEERLAALANRAAAALTPEVIAHGVELIESGWVSPAPLDPLRIVALSRPDFGSQVVGAALAVMYQVAAGFPVAARRAIQSAPLAVAAVVPDRLTAVLRVAHLLRAQAAALNADTKRWRHMGRLLRCGVTSSPRTPRSDWGSTTRSAGHFWKSSPRRRSLPLVRRRCRCSPRGNSFRCPSLSSKGRKRTASQGAAPGVKRRHRPH